MIRLISRTFLISAAMLLPWQQCVAQGTVRISVVAGGNVPFVFNSIDKYKNGITYADYTRLGIEIEDTSGAIDYYWRLTAEAQTANIVGSGVNTLPLSTLELTASDGGLGAKAEYVVGPLVLTNAPGITLVCRGVGPCVNPAVTLIGDEPNYPTVNDVVNITYDCGTTTSLLDEIADYYVVDIDFTLEVCFAPGGGCPF